MKKFLAHSITLISEIIVLVLGAIWLYKSGEIEPMIIIVVAFTSILVGLFFRNQDAPSTESQPIAVQTNDNAPSFEATKLKAKKNIGGTITQDKGKIKLDNITSKEGGIKFDIEQK